MLEEVVLKELPTMPRVQLMLRDISFTLKNMRDFQRFVMEDIDNISVSHMGTEYGVSTNSFDAPASHSWLKSSCDKLSPSQLFLIFQEGALHIHTITSTNWPMNFLSPRQESH